MAHGASFPYPTLLFVSFLSLATRTPNCHKAIWQDGALPLSGYTPASSILGTKQEPQGSFRKKNLWTLLGKDQASRSCKAPSTPSQTLMSFPQVLKALLKPSELLTRHTAGGSWSVFPDSQHGGSRTARKRTTQQQSSSCTAPAHAQQSHGLQQHGMGHWKATIPVSQALLQADHPAPCYPHDRPRATLGARLAHHQHAPQNPPRQPNGELVSVEFTSLRLKRVVKGLLHVICHQDLVTSSFLGQTFSGC